jgi:hypothetical protein
MTNEAFAFGLAIVCAFMVVWACRTLPAENWQILATIPIAKDTEGRWRGVNLTYYGVLTANAAVTAIALICVFMTALGISLQGGVALIGVELLLCLPAAKLVAQIVEKKRCTFTVAGAFFVGFVTTPWAITLLNWVGDHRPGFPLPVVATMATITVAYAFGEGLGRLACISFGCCYGKPLSQSSPLVQRMFERWHFVFSGGLKKIAYASRLEGERVLPIQALTAGIYLVTGLLSTILLLRAYFGGALLVSVAVTQGWRVISEKFRADYRGEGTWSIYQILSLLTIPYGLGMLVIFPSPSSLLTPDITLGLAALWNPWVVLFLQGLWLLLFLCFGKSLVTSSAISFRLHEDRI